MSKFSIVAENANSTVVGEFTPAKTRAINYQSEADLEQAFIKLLESQAYDFLPITTEADLTSNLRSQIEKLNNYSFSDTE